MKHSDATKRALYLKTKTTMVARDPRRSSVRLECFVRHVPLRAGCNTRPVDVTMNNKVDANNKVAAERLRYAPSLGRSALDFKTLYATVKFSQSSDS